MTWSYEENLDMSNDTKSLEERIFLLHKLLQVEQAATMSVRINREMQRGGIDQLWEDKKGILCGADFKTRRGEDTGDILLELFSILDHDVAPGVRDNRIKNSWRDFILEHSFSKQTLLTATWTARQLIIEGSRHYVYPGWFLRGGIRPDIKHYLITSFMKQSPKAGYAFETLVFWNWWKANGEEYVKACKEKSIVIAHNHTRSEKVCTKICVCVDYELIKPICAIWREMNELKQQQQSSLWGAVGEAPLEKVPCEHCSETGKCSCGNELATCHKCHGMGWTYEYWPA